VRDRDPQLASQKLHRAFGGANLEAATLSALPVLSTLKTHGAERRCAMKKIGTSVVSGAALLALTGTASAGPMSVASPQTVALKSQIEPAYYRPPQALRLVSRPALWVVSAQILS
jgi:hypothetical protein